MMKYKFLTFLLLTFLHCFLLSSCQKEKEKDFDKGTFGYDVERLKPIEGLRVLENGNSMIAISGIYQGRVFTSSAKGKHGKSYGYVNYDLIEKNEHETNMASLGGESRMWFAPEFGEYSLCFEKGKAQVGENMERPVDLNNKKLKEHQRSKVSLTVGGRMQLKNANDYVFDIDMQRTIRLLTKSQIEKNLDISISDKTSFVGFSAETFVRNIGKEQFKKENGLISIWELGCMLTHPDNTVIIPVSSPIDSVTTYFTSSQDRVKIQNEVVYYKADAEGMNKIGILPKYVKNIIGSYSPANKQLNIVSFTFKNDGPYLNSLPENSTPYQGDVVNIFNGEVNPEKEWNWPFYEFESASSAKELKPKEQMFHGQTTYHFEGSESDLDQIAKQVLGVSLQEIPAF